MVAMDKLGMVVVAACVVWSSARGVAGAQDGQGPPPPSGYHGQPQPQPYPQYGNQQYAPPPQQHGHAQPWQQPAPRPRRHKVPYYDGMQIPPDGEVVEYTRPGLWAPGIAMFAGMYAATILSVPIIQTASIDPDRRSAANLLYLPVIGPLLYFPSATEVGRSWLILNTIIQGGGLAMFIVGMVAKRRYLVYYAERPNGRTLALEPVVGLTTAGMTLRF
jgi:hypothetical protein